MFRFYHFGDWVALSFFGLLTIIPPALVLWLLWRILRGYAKRSITEAWWWLSAPASILLILTTPLFGHNGGALLVLALGASIAAAAWAIATSYRLWRSRTEQLTAKQIGMLTFAALPWVFWILYVRGEVTP